MATSISKPKFKEQQNYLGMTKSALHWHFRKKVHQLASKKKKLPKLQAFLPIHWDWITSYLKYVFAHRHPFLNYKDSASGGVYKIDESATISIAGDWGSGTREANEVAQLMCKSKPHYTIHLGDIYFVADESEVAENFLGQKSGIYDGVRFPAGLKGSFAVNGDHEMLGVGGNAYFEQVLPAMGIPGSPDKRQLASFFCLENQTWRILGLDTGYYGRGFPILGRIAMLLGFDIPRISPDCRLHNDSVDWLRKIVQPKERPRATIVLTHHQNFSAFEQAHPKAGEQLAEFFEGQDLLWLWGHEHRMAVYDKHTNGAITAYARCIGHGGLPVELASIKYPTSPLQFHDDRVYATYGKTKAGFNGFVNLAIEKNVATLEYRDLHDKTILREQFSAEGNSLRQCFTLIDSELSRGSAAPPVINAQSA